MIKLKDILSESKVGYLVEKELSPAEKKKKAEQKKVMATNIDFTIKKGKNKGKKDKITVRGALNQGEDHPAWKDAKRMVAKVDKTQKSAEKKVDKKDKKETEKLGKITVQTGDGEVEISKILPKPFGNAKDYSHKQADTAKEEVHDYYTEKFTDEEMKKVNKRVGKNGKLKKPLEGDEKKKYDKYKAEQEKYNKKNKQFKEAVKTEEEWLAEKAQERAEKRASIYDPDTGSEWEEDEDGGDGDDWLSDFGDDDDDSGWGEPKKTDDYGHKLSKRGDKTQQKAVEFKLRLGAGTLKKQKQEGHHYTTGEDGKVVALSVFKNEKTGKFYGVDDEGNIYENDKDDFRDMKEPTTNARGFEGAVTKKGQKTMNIRKGKGEAEDEYDKTTFSDLLGMLGIDTDIDWTDPFGSD